MDRRTELAGFLRSRRARVDPVAAGVPPHLGRRRVPGLRREEVAQLAGVSVDYYVRLEQGRADNVSDAVLDAVSRVLALDAPERTHLRQLTRPTRNSTGAAANQGIRSQETHDPAARNQNSGNPGTSGRETSGHRARGQETSGQRAREQEALGQGSSGQGSGEQETLGVVHRSGAAQPVRPPIRHLLEAMTDAAAFVVGRRTDVLAWNRLGAALIADLSAQPPRQRNFARLLFGAEDRAQALFADWPAKAQDLVAFLHADAGRHPDDPLLAELVAELSLTSDLFRRLWADHPVRDKGHTTAVLHHPLVGELALAYEALQLPDDPEQFLVTYSAPPASEAAASLRLLASWHATPINS